MTCGSSSSLLAVDGDVGEKDDGGGDCEAERSELCERLRLLIIVWLAFWRFPRVCGSHNKGLRHDVLRQSQGTKLWGVFCAWGCAFEGHVAMWAMGNMLVRGRRGDREINERRARRVLTVFLRFPPICRAPQARYLHSRCYRSTATVSRSASPS